MKPKPSEHWDPVRRCSLFRLSANSDYGQRKIGAELKEIVVVERLGQAVTMPTGERKSMFLASGRF
jgi:hypothetical protein